MQWFRVRRKRGVYLGMFFRPLLWRKRLSETTWYSVWAFCILTLAGILIGALTLYLSAHSMPELLPEQLMEAYLGYGQLLVLNLLPSVLCIWFFYFLVGRGWLSYLFTAIPVVGCALINYYKIQLRGDPFLAVDLGLVSEAGGITGNYTLVITREMELVFLWLLLGFLVVLCLTPGKMNRSLERIFVLLSSGVLFGVALLSLYCNAPLYEKNTPQEPWLNTWSETEVFLAHGFSYSFLYSIQDMLPTPPKGYDPKVAEMALARYEEQPLSESEKVNVVGIMLEAFCDLTDFPALAQQEGVQSVYELWHMLEEQSVSGNLLTNIFAGGTVDSEWCFLTGYSQYETFRKPTDSYVWYFNRQGYYTRGGHPGFGWFYNRENINDYLGFQEYWFTENHYGTLVDPVVAQWNSDTILVDEIVKDLKAHSRKGPVFSFSVSYQNHGPYESEYTSGTYYINPDTVPFTEETCHIFNNYLHGIEGTISAMQSLVNQLEEMQEPVVLVLFGDHKPWGGNGNSAYTDIGVDFDLSTIEGFYDYFSTPYLIWANTAAKEQLQQPFVGEGGDFSPCFLMNELFEQCGWTGGSSFLQLSEEMRQITPLVHEQEIYFDRFGRLTRELSGERLDSLNEYLYIQYYRQHKVEPEA